MPGGALASSERQCDGIYDASYFSTVRAKDEFPNSIFDFHLDQN